jgi:hypothetical protein
MLRVTFSPEFHDKLESITDLLEDEISRQLVVYTAAKYIVNWCFYIDAQDERSMVYARRISKVFEDELIGVL